MVSSLPVHYAPRLPASGVPFVLAPASDLACGHDFTTRAYRPASPRTRYRATDRASAVTCRDCRRIARKGTDHVD